MRPTVPGLAAALGAALLFGFANAAGRDAVASIHPLTLVALAYAIAGTALLPFLRNAKFGPKDVVRLLLIALSGGVVGPILFFSGLARTTAVNASLLIMSEIVFTTSLAYAFLSERLTTREWAGCGLVVAGAVVVAASAGANGEATLVGNLLILGAAVAWSVDNALSTRLLARHRAQEVVAVKNLTGGLVLLAATLALGIPLSVPREAWWNVAFIGLLGIGLSTVLFYASLRTVGASRTTMIFATSGFWGAVAGIVLLGEAFTVWHAVAAVLLAGGVAVLFGFRPSPSIPGERPL